MTDVHEARAVESAATTRTSTDPDEFGVITLLALAAGGVLGSGWLMGAYQASTIAEQWAWVSWLIGGALMLIVALVMVELGRHAPENGGLVFWPFQSSGPLVALVIAAALWVFYALNPATEAAAVVQAFGSPALYDYGSGTPVPTTSGRLLSAGLMIPITATNLLGLRLIRRSTVCLTAFKIFVPVAVVVLLFLSGFGHHTTTAHTGASSIGAVISAVTGSGIVYAYIGFQGPLDFAGQVIRKRNGRRMTEATRLRIAVLGTVIGSIVLYTLLQVVFQGHIGHSGWTPGNPSSPYTVFAKNLGIFGAATALLIPIDSVVSPAGAGIIFVLLLGREVESLSQVRLTDGRLAQPRRRIFARAIGLWPILLVNLVVGWIVLFVLGSDWPTMVAASGVLSLFVYVMPAVSLMAFRRHFASGMDSRFRIAWYWWILAWLGFVGGTEVLYWAGWQALWHGVVLVSGGVVLLAGLPLLSHRIEKFRLYDAENYVADFWTRRKDAEVQGAVKGAAVLVAYLGAMLVLSFLSRTHTQPATEQLLGSPIAAVLGTVVFVLLCKYSVEYMRMRNPVLLRPSE